MRRLAAAIFLSVTALGPVPALAGGEIVFDGDYLLEVHGVWIDDCEHLTFLDPFPEDLDVFIDEDGLLTVTGADGWVDVSGVVNSDGQFALVGEGEVAGFSGIAALFEGHAEPGMLDGIYWLGIEGRLPGGCPIAFEVWVVSLEEPPASTTSSTSSSTTTSSPSTTTTTTTTTMAEASTTSSVAPPTSITITDPDTGTSYTAWWWIGGILLVVGGGIFFFARDDDPCIPLKARWVKAQKECDEAKKRLQERMEKLGEAQKGLKDAEAERDAQDSKADDLRAELDALQRAGRSSVTYGGTEFHRIPEGLVTAEGLQSIMDSVQAQIDSHEQNMESWQESVDHWKDLVDEHQKLVDEAAEEVRKKCAEAEAARKAYEDCIKAAAAPPPAPTPEGEGDSGGGGTGGTGEGDTGGGTSTGGGGEPGSTPGGPGSAPPPEPEPEPECTEGDTREEVLKQESFTLPKLTQSMTLSIEPPTEEFADWMAEKMGSAGGRLSPSNLNDRSFPREVKSKLRGMDSGYGSTSHTVAVSFPRQEITYACIKHWRCVGGRWVEGHTEIREVSRRDLSPQAFTDTGHMNSSEVERIVGRAVSAYQQLARNADRVERMCE